MEQNYNPETAIGTDLDHIGVTHGVYRFTDSDALYRARILLYLNAAPQTHDTIDTGHEPPAAESSLESDHGDDDATEAAIDQMVVWFRRAYATAQAKGANNWTARATFEAVLFAIDDSIRGGMHVTDRNIDRKLYEGGQAIGAKFRAEIDRVDLNAAQQDTHNALQRVKLVERLDDLDERIAARVRAAVADRVSGLEKQVNTIGRSVDRAAGHTDNLNRRLAALEDAQNTKESDAADKAAGELLSQDARIARALAYLDNMNHLIGNVHTSLKLPVAVTVSLHEARKILKGE